MALKLAAGTGARFILTSSSDTKLDRVKKMPDFKSIETINRENQSPRVRVNTEGGNGMESFECGRSQHWRRHRIGNGII